MSISELSKTLLSQIQSQQTSQSASTSNSAGNLSFAESLSLMSANLRLQNVSTLTGADLAAAKSAGSNSVDSLLSSLKATESSAVSGLSATGRNTALSDPESAYKMMSQINRCDVSCKAQYAELSDMKSTIADLRQTVQSLGSVDASTSAADIKARLEKFAGQYNDWVKKFDADMQSGGVLDNVQAAQVARHELEQSVESIFNGAADGVRGLGSLGLSIDPGSKLAVFDPAKLDATLAANPGGTVSALQQFSANFVKSADLLVSDGNFIANRLDNLSRAISYIAANQSSLQAEFGLGDPAKPTGRAAEALAAYNKAHTA